MKDADTVPLKTFTEAGRLDSFTVHAGDASGVLKGSRLDEVAGLSLDGMAFTPGELSSAGGDDTLPLTTADPDIAKLKVGRTLTARLTLKDGRTATLKTVVAPPRPQVTLIGKSLQAAAPDGAAIQLSDAQEAPLGAQITFSVRAQPPTRFGGHEAIEVGSVDGSATTTLSPASGLTQEDAQVVLATLDTGKALGASASGPLQFRLVQDGSASDWQPLTTLVRLPTLRELKCREGHACELRGDNLFLLDAVSGDRGFEHAARVPEGFPGHMLSVPHPAAGRLLYIRLHDDPRIVSQAVFPAGG